MDLPFLFDEKRFIIPPNALGFVPDTGAVKFRAHLLDSKKTNIIFNN